MRWRLRLNVTPRNNIFFVLILSFLTIFVPLCTVALQPVPIFIPWIIRHESCPILSSIYGRFAKYPEHRSDLLRYLSLDSLDFNAAGAGGNFGDNNGDDDANEEGEEDDGDAYDDAENDYDMENADEMNAEADMAGEMPSPNDD